MGQFTTTDADPHPDQYPFYSARTVFLFRTRNQIRIRTENTNPVMIKSSQIKPIPNFLNVLLYLPRCVPIQCCGSGSGIRCIFDHWICDPGWVKYHDPDPRSGMKTWIMFPSAWKTFKKLKFFEADPGWKKTNPG